MYIIKSREIYFVSFKTALSLSNKMSACVGWKIRAGLKRTESFPHPPRSTPKKFYILYILNKNCIQLPLFFNLATMSSLNLAF